MAASDKPWVGTMSYDDIPLELRQLVQWCCWRFEDRGGKRTKVPCNPRSGLHASSTDRQSWASYEEATEVVSSGNYDGVGFFIDERNELVAIDLDNKNGDADVDRQNFAIAEGLNSYTERSPSGHGLHVWVHAKRGTIPRGKRSGNVEIYPSGRFMTMTGERVSPPDLSVEWRNDEVRRISEQLRSDKPETIEPNFTPATEDDATILRNAMQDGAFARLYGGDWSGYPTGGDGDGSSEADQAFCNKLWRWTRDPQQMDRIWLQSPLGQRSKTQRRKDYRDGTIRRAFDGGWDHVEGVDLTPLLANLNGRFEEAQRIVVPPIGPLPTYDVLDWFDEAPPAREWHVEEAGVPAGQVTLFSGHGGTGKSMNALQLAGASVTGSMWHGMTPRVGSCIVVAGEDDADECRRRVSAFMASEGLGRSDFGDRRFIVHPLQEASYQTGGLLAIPDKSGVMQPTVFYNVLKAEIDAIGPVLVVLDTSADLFGGDENNRYHVKQFVNLLRQLSGPSKAAILLLSHPSRSGMNDGDGTSGSTGWHNSVRSRMYLEYDGKTGAVKLKFMKSQYGPTQPDIFLRWSDGVWAKDDRTADISSIVHSGVRKAFLDLLDAYTMEGRNVNSTPCLTYAPTVFAKDHRFGAFGKDALVGAMNDLFAARMIHNVEHGRDGKRRKRIERVQPLSMAR